MGACMGSFTTFIYDTLKKNILALGKSYSTHLGRYSILDTPVRGQSFSESQNTLEVLIARTNEYVIQCKCDKGHETARDVFSQLTTELRPFIDGSPDEVANATLFLLGALIHRHFRLKISYDTYNNSPINLAGFFTTLWPLDNSELNKAINKALKLEQKNLDEKTIVDALEVFQQQMTSMIKVQDQTSKKTTDKTRYETYTHFAVTDQNFLKNLDDMIGKHKEAGAIIIREYKVIYFLQSLASELDKENAPVEKEMVEWCTALNKDYKDFKSLTQEKIQLHLDNYFKSKPEKNKIKEKILLEIMLGYEANIFDEVSDYLKFLEVLKTASTDESRTILCGGFVLLSQIPERSNRMALDEDFLTFIKSKFGFEQALTSQDKLECMKTLQTYLQNSIQNLNCEFFGGGDKIQTETSKLIVDLMKNLEKEDAATNRCTLTM